DAVEGFFRELLRLAAEHGVVVVGGDTSSSPAGWLVSVTVLGDCPAPPLLRSGARPGHQVAVTGALGRAAAGLALLEQGSSPPGLEAAGAEVRAAQLRPRPRVPEGLWLAQAGGVGAMMDLSDGLATDLGRLAEESGVRARVVLDRLPIDGPTRAVATALGQDPLRWATGGGEDFELLLTCEPGALPRLREGLGQATGTALVPIGEIVTGASGVSFLDGAGRVTSVEGGFEHFRAAPGHA
ncbi:MAG TPA: AIR synthase-related protein, partial [Vicinamibacteria bacterium]|nr:AIR synthase-related protein [Vicinamibacteria bacterium]